MYKWGLTQYYNGKKGTVLRQFKKHCCHDGAQLLTSKEIYSHCRRWGVSVGLFSLFTFHRLYYQEGEALVQ